jgi:ribosomal protein L28
MSYKIFEKKLQSKSQFYITKRKVIFALIILLTSLAALKTNSAGNYNKRFLDSSTAIVALKFSEMSENLEYREALTKEPFCGWKISENNQIISSDNYTSTSQLGNIINKEIDTEIGKRTISVCITETSVKKIDSTTRNNIIFIIIVGISLFLLILTEPTNKKDEDENESNSKEIPTA